MEARDELERSLVLRPDQPFAHIHLARVLLALGQPEQALQRLQAAVRLDPRVGQDVHFLDLLAQSYAASGRPVEARRTAQAAAQRARAAGQAERAAQLETRAVPGLQAPATSRRADPP
jgi:predicted Zn-dependent protease